MRDAMANKLMYISLLNYVSYVPTCLTCLRALCFSCLRDLVSLCLHAQVFMFYILRLYVLHAFVFTSLHNCVPLFYLLSCLCAFTFCVPIVFLCFTSPRAYTSLCFMCLSDYVPSCFTCQYAYVRLCFTRFKCLCALFFTFQG